MQPGPPARGYVTKIAINSALCDGVASASATVARPPAHRNAWPRRTRPERTPRLSSAPRKFYCESTIEGIHPVFQRKRQCRCTPIALPNFVEKAAMRLSCVSPTSERVFASDWPAGTPRAAPRSPQAGTARAAAAPPGRSSDSLPSDCPSARTSAPSSSPAFR
jgi:hypothetical protein